MSPWQYLAARWRAWRQAPAPALQRAHEKRRLEALLQAEGLSRSVARRITAVHYSESAEK